MLRLRLQDLPRTFPSHPWLATPDGQTALRRALRAFSIHCPSVGYCQGLNFVCAIILLVMEKKEEDAFYVLSALIEKKLYQGTYTSNLSGCHVVRALDLFTPALAAPALLLACMTSTIRPGCVYRPLHMP